LKQREQAAELLWVVDGVITQRERLEWQGPVSFALLVSGTGLDTDLTGLALRETDSYFERRDSAMSEAAREVSSRDIRQDKGLLKFYSEHPLAKLLAWAEKRLHGTLGRRVPLRVGRLAPHTLECRSLELEKAFRAVLNSLRVDKEAFLPPEASSQ
jgi:hypothetical protein